MMQSVHFFVSLILITNFHWLHSSFTFVLDLNTFKFTNIAIIFCKYALISSYKNDEIVFFPYFSLLFPSFMNYIICMSPDFITHSLFYNYNLQVCFNHCLSIKIQCLRTVLSVQYFALPFVFFGESHSLVVFWSAYENHIPQVTACFHSICLFAYTWKFGLYTNSWLTLVLRTM